MRLNSNVLSRQFDNVFNARLYIIHILVNTTTTSTSRSSCTTVVLSLASSSAAMGSTTHHVAAFDPGLCRTLSRLGREPGVPLSPVKASIAPLHVMKRAGARSHQPAPCVE